MEKTKAMQSFFAKLEATWRSSRQSQLRLGNAPLEAELTWANVPSMSLDAALGFAWSRIEAHAESTALDWIYKNWGIHWRPGPRPSPRFSLFHRGHFDLDHGTLKLQPPAQGHNATRFNLHQLFVLASAVDPTQFACLDFQVVVATGQTFRCFATGLTKA